MRAAKHLCALGIVFLAALSFFSPANAQTENPPSTPTANQMPDKDAFGMPYQSYFIAGDCHDDGWQIETACALDINNKIDGGELLSPINGRVDRMGTDGYGNPYLVIVNSRYEVYMLHGIYDLVQVGDEVSLGQVIGQEASIGNSTGAHTHLTVYDWARGEWVDPRLLVNVDGVNRLPPVNPVRLREVADMGEKVGLGLLAILAFAFVVSSPLRAVVVIKKGLKALGRDLIKVIQFGDELAYWIRLAGRGTLSYKVFKQEKKTRRKLLFKNVLFGVMISVTLAVVALLSVIKGGPGETLAYMGQPPNLVFPTLPSLPGQSVYEIEQARISHYWPPLGGPNCSNFVDGLCISRMASGLRWQENIDKALACPAEFPFGTKFVVLGREWTCWDRGGKIIRETDGTIWLDLLTETPLVPFGTTVEVVIIRLEK